MCEKVAVSLRIQTDIAAADSVVFANKGPISNTCHKPQRFIDRDVKRFFPCKATMSTFICAEGERLSHIEDLTARKSSLSSPGGFRAHQKVSRKCQVSMMHCCPKARDLQQGLS